MSEPSAIRFGVVCKGDLFDLILTMRMVQVVKTIWLHAIQLIANCMPGTFYRGRTMMKASKAERRLAHEQALASVRIEGFEPSPEFLADCEAVIEGTVTRDEARAASLARALAKDRLANACSGVQPAID